MLIPKNLLRMDDQSNCLLKLRVHPGARRSSISGILGDALKIELQAPPVDGKANTALIKFLADTLKIRRNMVELKSGECSRDKVVKISGMTPEQIISILKVES